MAAELLNVQARRDAKVGINFPIDQIQYDLFASQFAFEETPDQTNAIEAVKFDISKISPMDRLVCGDVGFGKTEVAMRRRFYCHANGISSGRLRYRRRRLLGKYETTFWIDLPIGPFVLKACLALAPKTTRCDSQRLSAEGKIDIVIGTHRILQRRCQVCQPV